MLLPKTLLQAIYKVPHFRKRKAQSLIITTSHVQIQIWIQIRIWIH